MDGGARAVLWVWAYAWQLAYDTGRAHERERIGGALAELDACRPLARRTWEQQVAERVALYEQCAHAGHERWGTRPWPGWDAMGPAQRAASMRWLLGTWEPQSERRAAA